MRWLLWPGGCAAVVALASVAAPPPSRPSLPASDPAGCPPCHQRARPTWHDDAMTAPDRDARARGAHAAAAAERGGCASCHTATFAASCGRCHDANEAWLQEPP